MVPDFWPLQMSYLNLFNEVSVLQAVVDGSWSMAPKLMQNLLTIGGLVCG